ncbi:MAG: Spy/CpxP family protein refolding chaperone [Gloeobacterales cyanobacterium]
MMSNSKLLGLCALLIFASSGIAHSQPKIDFSQLNLSPEQKQSIQQIRQTDGAQVQKLRQDVKASRMQLRTLVNNDAPDDKVQQELDRLLQLQNQLMRLRINNWIKIRKVLTPAQKAQIRDQLEADNKSSD